MHRTLAALAGAAAGVFLLSGMANVVMIRQQTGPEPRREERRPLEVRLSNRSAQPEAASATDADPDRREIVERAERLLGELITDADPLARDWRDAGVSHTQFLVDAQGGRRWITETEVRAPCELVDRALAAVRNPDVGRPDHCERFLERIGSVLERRGLAGISARDFVREHDVRRKVRVMVIYAGWKKHSATSDRIDRIEARVARVHPRRAFAERRQRALDAVYRAMELGPYANGAAATAPG